jgi:hypothetical protein
MSSLDNFVGSIEFDTSSVDDCDSVGESNLDSASTFDTVQASKSYWLGKMFMRFAQAHAVLRDSSPEETVTDVDVSESSHRFCETQMIHGPQVKLEDRLRKYPYIESLKSLQEYIEALVPATVRQNTSDDYEAFLCTIGLIMTRNDKLDSRESCTLFRGLQYRGDDMATQWTKALETKRDPDRSQSPKKPPEIALKNYYDELQRYSHRIGEELKRKNSQETRRQGGRRWIVTLTLRGQDFVGKDSELQEALVKAAQRGYEAFQLEVT